MPTTLVVTLFIVIVVLIVLRLTVRMLPLQRWSRPIRPLDGVLAALGVLGLVLHCGAMFFPAVLGVVPGSAGYAAVVNALGTGSVVLYVVPAVLSVVGLRHQQRAVVALLVIVLAVVGITMYDGGPLEQHLAAITAAILVLAATGTLLIRPPARSSASVPA